VIQVNFAAEGFDFAEMLQAGGLAALKITGERTNPSPLDFWADYEIVSRL
jgi:hypothetical protein